MQAVFLTDFDGTVSQDVLLTIFKRFAAPQWEEAMESYKNGQIGSRKLYETVIPTIRVTQQEWHRFLYYHCFVDPGFAKLRDLCRQTATPLAIVSDGLDLYIRRMLKNADMEDVPVYSNRAAFDGDRINIAFPPLPEECPCGACANCKRAVCWQYRQDYPTRTLIYAGDGLSDIKVLEDVDTIYAKGTLAEYCQEQGIAYTRFENFNDIVSDMERILT
ncbi:HAD-IB family phosphatase [Dethiobacter alkaliphilus]|uniref:HAD-superfamily hydrolase subfamily IB hypothetical 1 n=1 Tax=Dethiobacter alkaliphilus AHT 1 TaxID=555088 RepID=C0GIK8_DETAL|nr:HAD-IB family phosphatase [Dethiobacter alkaliphilus]EEG76869.1 HAD-superfamily hydrolase subfamily IB hypothetical 1 [Dethiobacter alkaliphilus AHT 1]